MRYRPFLTAALLALPLAAQQQEGIGQPVPEFTFPQFLNGDGRQQLSQFYGQPVVIDLWGTH
jgi:hypothetical protein